MLAGELKFYADDQIIKSIDSEEYEKFSVAELKCFVQKLACEIGATKVIENCIYHNHHAGINTTIYPFEDNKEEAYE